MKISLQLWKEKKLFLLLKKNVARCDGACFTEDLYINNDEDFWGGDLMVDHVETDRVVLEDDWHTFYYKFDELSDEELEHVLNAVLPK